MECSPFAGCQAAQTQAGAIHHPLMRFLCVAVRLAALLHDIGKGTHGFQKKLIAAIEGESVSPDLLRHEAVSALFMDVTDPQVFLAIDSHAALEQYMAHRARALVDPSILETASNWLIRVSLLRSGEQGDLPHVEAFADGFSFNQSSRWTASPFWCSVLWLIYTHHKLLHGRWARHLGYFVMTPEAHYRPENDAPDIATDEGGVNLERLPLFLSFDEDGQPWSSVQWRERVLLCLSDLRALRQELADSEQSFFRASGDGFGDSTPWMKLLTRMGRLALVAGDYEASCDAIKGYHAKVMPSSVYANTKDINGRLYMGDTLDVHLCKTEQHAERFFLGFYGQKPDFFSPGVLGYENLPGGLAPQGFPEQSPFLWQDYAQDIAFCYRNDPTGMFAVVASGTGRGKTRACASMMAHAREKARYSTLLSMRSLTFQTAKAYLSSTIGYHPDQVAMFVGDDILRRRFRQERKQMRKLLRAVGTSNCMARDAHDHPVLYQGQILDLIQMESLKENFFLMRALSAPVSVMTVDHVMQAVNLQRSSDLLQLLHLMTTDLILDEIDDYKGHDLVCIGRLIELAGMFGRKVIIASATLPRTIVSGFYDAYCEGFRVHQALHGISELPNAMIVTHSEPYVSQPYVDESFETFYERTMTDFCRKEEMSAKTSPRRSSTEVSHALHRLSARLLKARHPLSALLSSSSKIVSGVFSRNQKAMARDFYFESLMGAALHGHMTNPLVCESIRYSAGAIRLNSVVSAQAFMEWLTSNQIVKVFEKAGVIFRFICYHAQNIGLIRYKQESFLDNHLKRAVMNDGASDPLLAHPAVMETFKQAGDQKIRDVVFVIVTTSIFETGRDYDLDWAVLEPCSTTSAVQFGGRVRRHRTAVHEKENILLMPCSLEAMTNPVNAWRDLKSTPFQPKAKPNKAVAAALRHLDIDPDETLRNAPSMVHQAFNHELINGTPLHAGHCLLNPASYRQAPLASMERVFQLSLFRKQYAIQGEEAYTLEYALKRGDVLLCDAFYQANQFRGGKDIIRIEYLTDIGWAALYHDKSVRSINELIRSHFDKTDEDAGVYLLSELNFKSYTDLVDASHEIGRELGYVDEDLSLATSALLSTQRDKADERLIYCPQTGFSRDT